MGATLAVVGRAARKAFMRYRLYLLPRFIAATGRPSSGDGEGAPWPPDRRLGSGPRPRQRGGNLTGVRRLLVLAFALQAAACGGDNAAGAGAQGAPEIDEAGLADGAPALATDDDSGEAIVAPDRQWTWVPMPRSRCRDGSSTGMAVSLSSTSKKVMIFLQSGGACYNPNTCFGSAGSFGLPSFDDWKSTNGQVGVFDRGHKANPVSDYNYFFLPYCSGDMHAGDAENVVVPGVSAPQQFVGYRNVGLALQRILATVPDPEAVLLAGDSAGGFGATLNYFRVQQAYGDVPVTLLDDSGPMLGAEFINPCLLDLMRGLWRVDTTVLQDCGPACSAPGAGLSDFLKQAVVSHPKSRFGLVSSLHDEAIRQFLGLAEGNCVANVGYPEEKFELALVKLREQLTPYSNFDTFYVGGGYHTFINAGRFYTTTNGSQLLPAWVQGSLQ
jgi:hypothetical protein